MMDQLKKISTILLFCTCFINAKAMAQSQEVQQLLLNVEKLSQFKNILSDMKAGYQIISKGYNAVRDISKGNFSLHATFIDGLMQVSPEIRKYHKVAEIITAQGRIISEYKSAFKRFSGTGSFTATELAYISNVYRQLNGQSLQNLDALLSVVTAGILRMNDQERLQAIDRILADTEDKLSFLRHFNSQGLLLSLQRTRESSDISGMQELFQVNP